VTAPPPPPDGRTAVTVSFSPLGRHADYLIDPARMRVGPGSLVVVEAPSGLALGKVVSSPHPARKGPRLLKVVRPARDTDLRVQKAALAREPEAVRLTLRWIRDNDKPWKLLRVVADGVGDKLTICFAARDREDCRIAAGELGRTLSSRVDLRQVGMRDLTRVMGGQGRCGREFCCASWMTSYPTPSIRMAKDQNLALSPDKTTGTCGKALCCLAFEHEHYKELRKWLPKPGKRARTTDGLEGKVVGLDVLRQTFSLLDERGRRYVLAAEAWEANEGKELPGSAVPNTVTHTALPAIDPADAGVTPGSMTAPEPVTTRPDRPQTSSDSPTQPARRRRRRRRKKKDRSE
jgi:cell fate regulator YaaT (PSP1 superfamily)